jgi:hypothetical protein
MITEAAEATAGRDMMTAEAMTSIVKAMRLARARRRPEMSVIHYGFNCG